MIGAVAAGVVGAVFVVSGVTKLARPQQWRAQSRELVAPTRLLDGVPIFEVALGAVLAVQWQRHVFGWVAAAVLAAFTVLIAVRLAQGRRPPCACFGTFSAAPIGWGHLVRNGALIALAILAAVA
ncbi:MAG: hypothetical protein JWM12_779 [Ilumatobacteraceae bacterium]|nr:hypothetical protein [Ilumatobacteraceae bacterium]